jgi:hypothetical protein
MAIIRWIRDVFIDERAHAFEIMMSISDIYYAKIDSQPEISNCYSVIETGCKIIKQPFDWK